MPSRFLDDRGQSLPCRRCHGRCGRRCRFQFHRCPQRKARGSPRPRDRVVRAAGHIGAGARERTCASPGNTSRGAAGTSRDTEMARRVSPREPAPLRVPAPAQPPRARARSSAARRAPSHPARCGAAPNPQAFRAGCRSAGRTQLGSAHALPDELGARDALRRAGQLLGRRGSAIGIGKRRLVPLVFGHRWVSVPRQAGDRAVVVVPAIVLKDAFAGSGDLALAGRPREPR